jgi:hypothetical protein
LLQRIFNVVEELATPGTPVGSVGLTGYYPGQKLSYTRHAVKPWSHNRLYQIFKFVIRAASYAFAASSCLYAINLAGELPNSEFDSLLQLYACSDGSLSPVPTADCQTETLSLFTSFYFMTVTLSTGKQYWSRAKQRHITLPFPQWAMVTLRRIRSLVA